MAMAAPQAPDDLVVLVIRVAKAIVDRLRSENPEGPASPLTPVHGLAAHYLLSHDNVTTAELARHLHITKQSASEVVALLEQTGTVVRAPHPSDGRARVVLLTDDGRNKLESGRVRWQRIEDEWRDLVGERELATVRDALEQYLARADQAIGTERP
jgi:DNA-binding MarR family transcriptional regulator